MAIKSYGCFWFALNSNRKASEADIRRSEAFLEIFSIVKRADN